MKNNLFKLAVALALVAGAIGAQARCVMVCKECFVDTKGQMTCSDCTRTCDEVQ